MKMVWLRLLFTLFFQPALAPPAGSNDRPPPMAPPPPQAPINAHINSTNFKHVLCWDPAPGEPPQTLYVVQTKVRGQRWREVSRSSDRCLQIKLENEVMYKLMVKTLSNTTLSPPSNIVTFYPARQSQVGPPHLSLAGCGDCIQINVSLPQADKGANIPDIQKYYGVPFTVLYRKKNSRRLMNLTTFDRSFTLSNLEKGAEYCVQVALTTHLNQLTTPSAWTCIFSGPAPGTELSGLVAPVLSVGILLLIFIVVFLGYTGSLWKLGVPLPEALLASLPSELTVTPERTVPDPLALRSRQRADRPAPSPVAATTDCSELEGDEEEESINDYMDRDPGLSSGRHLSPEGPPPGDPPAPPGDPSAAPAVQDPAKESNEELQSCSSDVDLFSVTLASLAVTEARPQEEQDNYDLFREPRMNCLFSGDLRSTLIEAKAVESAETLIAGDLTVSDCDDDETSPLLQVETEQRPPFSEYLVHQ